MTTEIHTSMTGLESCFEEELAHANQGYFDADRVEFSHRAKSKPHAETEDDRRMEEEMHLGT